MGKKRLLVFVQHYLIVLCNIWQQHHCRVIYDCGAGCILWIKIWRSGLNYLPYHISEPTVRTEATVVLFLPVILYDSSPTISDPVSILIYSRDSLAFLSERGEELKKKTLQMLTNTESCKVMQKLSFESQSVRMWSELYHLIHTDRLFPQLLNQFVLSVMYKQQWIKYDILKWLSTH